MPVAPSVSHRQHSQQAGLALLFFVLCTFIISTSAFAIDFPKLPLTCLPNRAEPSWDFETGKEYTGKDLPSCHCPPKSYCGPGGSLVGANMNVSFASRCCKPPTTVRRCTATGVIEDGIKYNCEGGGIGGLVPTVNYAQVWSWCNAYSAKPTKDKALEKAREKAVAAYNECVTTTGAAEMVVLPKVDYSTVSAGTVDGPEKPTLEAGSAAGMYKCYGKLTQRMKEIDKAPDSFFTDLFGGSTSLTSLGKPTDGTLYKKMDHVVRASDFGSPKDFPPLDPALDPLASLMSGLRTPGEIEWMKEHFSCSAGYTSRSFCYIEGPICMPGPSCLSPESQVTMADGSKKVIASIQQGDKVKTPDGDATVQMVVRLEWPELVLYTINEGGNALQLTGDHPVKTTDGWKAIDYTDGEPKYGLPTATVKKLRPGDKIITEDGELEVLTLKPSAPIKDQVTYNLRLDQHDMFYANGILVRDN